MCSDEKAPRIIICGNVQPVGWIELLIGLQHDGYIVIEGGGVRARRTEEFRKAVEAINHSMETARCTIEAVKPVKQKINRSIPNRKQKFINHYS